MAGIRGWLAAAGWGCLAAASLHAGKGTPVALLDARVSPNVAVGSDPAALPIGEQQQAEPHVYRSAANPDLLLAAVQEGRFPDADGGSAAGGYAISTDGGFTWRQALLPNLTAVTGGPYFRSTDPVAAIDLQGTLYVSTLDARNSDFSLDDLVVSRSTDGGSTWTHHVAYSNPNAQFFADKDWLAVNDFAGTPHVGRLVATFSGFKSTASGVTTGVQLLSVYSDDGGNTWSAPAGITGTDDYQGTQPFFLPDGSLICIYQHYTADTVFHLECKRSTDGGATWPAAAVSLTPDQVEFDDQIARTGGGLPAVAVARNTGAIFATWQAILLDGSIRILAARSTDQGATWTPVQPVSDNPAAVAVFNPAVAVTPDGTAVTVVFYDKRLAPDLANFVDMFAAQSFDGGVTWAANLRLSDVSSDLRLAEPNERGFMLGDYLGIAPALTATQGAFALWCDTRNGQSDLYGTRIAPKPQSDFAAWQSVRFTAADQASGLAGPNADPDGDGYDNLAEYYLGTDPHVAESGAFLSALPNASATAVQVSWFNRPDAVGVTATPQVSTDGGATWQSPATIPLTAAPTLVRLALTQGNAVSTPPDSVALNGTSRLINLSARAYVGNATTQALTAGFVTGGGIGSQARTYLLRGIGPTLAAYGVSNPLPDPFLTVQEALTGNLVGTNNNWGDGGQAPLIITQDVKSGGFGLPAGSLDSAFVLSGEDTSNYTLTVVPAATLPNTGSSPVPGAPGVALAEIYDTSPAGTPGKLFNLSARANAGTGSSTLTAGFVIGGSSPKRVLLRTVGPTLGTFGVTGMLADPVITVYRADGTVIASNDDWSLARSPSLTAAVSARIGAFALPANSLDAALVLTLSPGLYTVGASGADGGTGAALIEIYDAD